MDAEKARAYTRCSFTDGLEIVEVKPLLPGVTARAVETAGGTKRVDMLSGIRVMFAYPNTDFFANVKAEKLPGTKHAELKQVLIENFNYVANSPSTVRNGNLGSELKRLDEGGEDRDKLEGGVIGIYLFFDDRTRVVTTVYLLNQDPSRRKFRSMEEYKSQRDKFLSAYVSCIGSNAEL